MKKLLMISISILMYSAGFSQMGGKHAYEFLNLVSSPKVAALGGKYISSADDDLALAYHNPSLLNEQMQNHVTLNFVKYFADVNYGYAAYANKFGQKNTVAAGIQYINYGDFTAADTKGNITGSFTAAEYALNLTFAHRLDSFFTIGADARPILSILEKYKSFGLSTDIGITYHNPHKLQTIALVIRNLGSQIKPYYDMEYESLPFEIQAGFTQELKYAPFRIMVTAHHLEMPEMSIAKSEDETSKLTSEVNPSNKKGAAKIADQVMRHLIFGIEFIPFKNFYVRAGYNYQRRQELKIDTHAGTVGFSWGFGFSISRFQLSYGRAAYHLAGPSNHFSVATDLASFYRKNVKAENN